MTIVSLKASFKVWLFNCFYNSPVKISIAKYVHVLLGAQSKFQLLFGLSDEGMVHENNATRR